MREPLGWFEVKLKDVAEEVTVGYVGPMTSEYKLQGVPFLRSKNVKPYSINLEDIRYISETFHTKIKKSKLQPGDVVIVRTGEPGLTAVVPDWLQEANCSDLVIVRPSESLNPHYLAYFVNAAAAHQISANTVGAVQQHFNVGAAKELTIPLPKKSEQDEIVKVLRFFDGKIELNRQMNRTLEDIAQATFKSWFVDFDPVVAKADGRQPYGMSAEVAALFPDRFEESELGEVPEGWSRIPVADIARYVNGKNFTKNATGTGRMVVRIAELNSGPGNSTKYNDVEAAEENTAFPGDILFSWSGSLNVYRWFLDEALVNQHIFKVLPVGYPEWFVYYSLKQVMPFFQMIAAGKATTMGHIRRGHLSQAKTALPPQPVIDAAHCTIAPVYQQVFENERESQTLADTRDALLPKLLSGEIRVEQAEKVVEGVL